METCNDICSPPTGEKPFAEEHQVCNGNKFLCNACVYTAHDENDLQHHKTTHHLVTRFVCGECNLILPSLKDLEEHVQIHTKQIHKNDDASFTNKNQRNAREYSAEPQNNFPKHGTNYACSECNFSTKYARSLRRHIRRIHKRFTKNELATGGLSRSACDYTTKDRRNIRKHVDKHKKVSNHLKCAQCSFTTNKQRYLKKHIKRHAPLEYSCTFCNFKTHRNYSLKRHLKNVHAKNKCEESDPDRSNEKQSTDELVTPTEIFSCESCGLKGIQEKDLVRHREECQTCADPFICGLCDLALPTEDDLIKHFEIHADEY